MHYNMHNMVAYGYDNDTYFISDTVIEKRVEISYEDLVRVRFAKGAIRPEGQALLSHTMFRRISISGRP